ncbi:MAG: inositol monophosphatase family protein, partial [Rhodospirillales bacterium]
MLRTPLINVMTAAAQKAARGLIRDFGEVEHLQISKKGPADFVSTADRKAETILFEELQRARPKYGFLMEERGAVEGVDTSNRWIIDPLDGTTNFLHGIPQFAISIGLERDGQIFAGVVYNPITDEMFVAEKGQGAFLNGRRLRVSARRDISEALFATGIPFVGRGNHDLFLNQLRAIMAVSAGVRRNGAA